MAKSTQQDRIEKTLSELPLAPESRVLDIGAGPGILTVPLARRVSHVTAVDASEGMISVLKEKAATAGVKNVDCTCRRWESVDPNRDLAGPYDVVIASLCLTMFDLQSAVSKMEKVCRGYIFLYWFLGETGWEDQRRMFEPFAPGIGAKSTMPKSELLLKALRQIGIYPEIEIFPYVHIDRFDSIDAAVDHFVQRFGISPANQTAALRACVTDLLEARHNAYILRSEAECMKIRWRVEQSFNHGRQILFH
ncbi:MAG: class I SAM-dependent methyltransferase [Desulfobacterales bacterium]